MKDATGYMRLAAEVLDAHQRREDGNCLCGRLRLGDSWAEHVVEVLDVAGALRDRPPPEPFGATLGATLGASSWCEVDGCTSPVERPYAVGPRGKYCEEHVPARVDRLRRPL